MSFCKHGLAALFLIVPLAGCSVGYTPPPPMTVAQHQAVSAAFEAPSGLTGAMMSNYETARAHLVGLGFVETFNNKASGDSLSYVVFEKAGALTENVTLRYCVANKRVAVYDHTYQPTDYTEPPTSKALDNLVDIGKANVRFFQKQFQSPGVAISVYLPDNLESTFAPAFYGSHLSGSEYSAVYFSSVVDKREWKASGEQLRVISELGSMANLRFEGAKASSTYLPSYRFGVTIGGFGSC